MPVLAALLLLLPASHYCQIATSPSSSSFVYPLKREYVSSWFGARADPLSRETRRHAGIDLVPAGDPSVHSIDAGIVVYAGPFGGYGNLVSIQHADGYSSHYAHLASIFIAVGDHVGRGAMVGLVGATGRTTGEHLHFEIRVRGCPLDPRLLLSGLGADAAG